MQLCMYTFIHTCTYRHKYVHARINTNMRYIKSRMGNVTHHSDQNESSAMFPVRCACVRAHTGRKTSAHKKTWIGQHIFAKKCLLSYSALIIKISPNNLPALSPKLLTFTTPKSFPSGQFCIMH